MPRNDEDVGAEAAAAPAFDLQCEEDSRRQAQPLRGDAFYWGQLMAGALLGSIPVALIYSFFVKYYVAGLTAGAVKG